jgi:hypothetical protein
LTTEALGAGQCPQFERHSPDSSSVINELFSHYKIEGIDMPYTMEDFRRYYRQERLKELTPEERLEGLSTEEILKRLPPEERLKDLSAEEILRSLPEDVIHELRKQLEKESDRQSNGAEG